LLGEPVHAYADHVIDCGDAHGSVTSTSSWIETELLVFVGNCLVKRQLELEHPAGGVMVTPAGAVQLNWYELAVELPVFVSVAVTVVVAFSNGFGVTVKRIVFAAFAGSANAASMTAAVSKPNNLPRLFIILPSYFFGPILKTAPYASKA
jgi:hypothetical protein